MSQRLVIPPVGEEKKTGILHLLGGQQWAEVLSGWCLWRGRICIWCLLHLSVTSPLFLTAALLICVKCARLILAVLEECGLTQRTHNLSLPPGHTVAAAPVPGQLVVLALQRMSQGPAGPLRQVGVKAENWHGTQAGWVCETPKCPPAWRRALWLGN